MDTNDYARDDYTAWRDQQEHAHQDAAIASEIDDARRYKNDPHYRAYIDRIDAEVAQMIADKIATLPTCPVCGHKPEFQYQGYYQRLQCSNPDCPTKPCTAWGMAIHEKQTIEDWKGLNDGQDK